MPSSKLRRSPPSSPPSPLSPPTPPMSRDSSLEGKDPANDARSRISKKDEAIRKKVEQELQRSSRKSRRSSKAAKADGTVRSLRPTQALTVRESFLVVEAASLMAAKRADCVLVIDAEDSLSGIFTAKDLACRVVGEGLDPKTTTVARIMTRDPQCVRSDSSATFALETMVRNGFRHLPVCNEEGDVAGLLDITKCLYEALDKLERAYGSSKKLHDALEGVEKEWSNQPPHVVQYLDILQRKMACPDLCSVLDGSPPVEINTRASVRDAARLMREHRTTAILVTEHGALAGIFTSKDVVLRVIAAGLDPATCNVARVMTPHPDTVPSTTSILEALRKMHDGHYLNLPVVDEGNVLGMVDVLMLTYATVEQIYRIQGNEPGVGPDAQGPVWNHFWNGFADDDKDSVISESITPSQSASNVPPPSPNQRQRHSGNSSPEMYPFDSSSVIDDGSIASFPRAHDDSDFTFKFKAPSGKTHRFTIDYTIGLGALYEAVAAKLPTAIRAFSLSYVDDDGDQVIMASDDDVIDAVRCAERQRLSRVILLVQEVDEHRISKSRSTRADDYDEDEEDVRDKRRRRRRDKPAENNGFNIPKEMLLPSALATLALSILGVFAVARLAR